MTTTCVHQFVGNDTLQPTDIVVSYFCCDRIGIAIRLESHVAHCFYAGSFSHRTPLSIVIKTVENEQRVFYHIPDFNIFAWGGKSSGEWTPGPRAQEDIDLEEFERDEYEVETDLNYEEHEGE
jgi:hypothetical protein